MLETEEVDVDYFTPSSSTSLSKIFASSSKEEDVSDKSSLKYNAPLPPQVLAKSEEPKQTQYLFSGTVYTYEWISNSYEFRGRLGFAILKIVSYNIHQMIIYDSKKTPLSSLTISDTIVIKVNRNNSLSYYDDVRKFWCINPSAPNLQEILDILRSLNVNLELVSEERGNAQETILTEYAEKGESINNKNENEKESDTDASFSRKTKDSILKRMATMGQSVLPPSHAGAVQTSDSSDTNEPKNPQKPRCKPKVANKKALLEKKSLDTSKLCEFIEKTSPPKPEKSDESHEDLVDIDHNLPLIMSRRNNEVMKPMNIDVETNSLGIFVSEQKLSNSELRINMNRMADKLDILLDKVKDLDVIERKKTTNNSNVSQFQNEITLKLLNEYEKKINKYEEFIKLKGFDCDTFELASLSKSDNVHQSKNLEELQKLCNEKDNEIMRLKEELKNLCNKEAQFQNDEKRLLKEINDLKNKLNETNAHTVNKSDDKQCIDITNKLKQIMNDTFQAIAANFNDEESYTGAKIKGIVGLVVKKTTIESTNKLKQIMNDTFQAIAANFNDEESYTGAKIKGIVGLVVKKTTIESLKDL